MKISQSLLAIFLLFGSLTLLGQSAAIPNKIDFLQTDKSVFDFVHQHSQYNGRELYENYRNETRQTADSLKVRNWVKTDIDNNGETDLLVFRADNLPKILAILSFGDRWVIASAKYNDCKYQFLYPVVKIVDNQKVILLYNQNQVDYDRKSNHFVYTKLACDTLLVRNNLFVNYVRYPISREIERIDISNDGVCEGECPRMNIQIDAHTFSSKCSKEMNWDNKAKVLTGQLTEKEIKQILELIGNSNFTDLNKYYQVGCTDQTTTTLTITYDNGKTKVIRDYGSSGNFTLAEIYRIAYGIRWTEQKGE